MGTLSIYESLAGLSGEQAATVKAAITPLAPWAGAAEIFQTQAKAKEVREQRKLVSATTAYIAQQEAGAAAEFQRLNALEDRKQKLRISVGKKADRMRYDAGIAARLYDKVAGKIAANGLESKYGSELRQISDAVTAGISEVSSVDLNTANLDELGSLDVEIDTAQWVVTEGRARLERLSTKIDDEIKAEKQAKIDQERAARAEAQALDQAAKDAKLAQERAEFDAARDKKISDLKLWTRLQEEIRKERLLLERDLAKLAALVRSA